jgi:hypothetical protein
MTAEYDVRSTFVRTLETDRAEAHRLLAQTDPMRSLADQLAALGLEDRALWSRTGELAHSMIWRFGPEAGHARIDWRLALDTDGVGRTTLSLEVGGRGSDAEARGRVLRAWLLVEQLSRSLTARLARMVDDYAEEEPVSAPRLLAVGMGA